MKEFAYFLATKDVKKQSSDVHLAKSTAKDSVDRLEMAQAILLTQKPKYVLENAYESTRELIDAILYAEGYKSYSHEASVSYLLNIGFSIKEAEIVDWLRRKRNGIKYYGEDVELNDAKEAIKIAKATNEKLMAKLKILIN